MAIKTKRSKTSTQARLKGASSRKALTRGQLQQEPPFDFMLVGIVAVLIGLGLVMVFSASYVQANAGFGQSTWFFLRQLRWLVLGIIAMVVLALIDYRQLKRFSVLIMGATVFLLFLVLLVAQDRLGAKLHLISGSIQPSEMAKLSIALYIAYWLTSKGERLKDISYGLVPFAILLGLITTLIVLQPDFGTAAVVLIMGLVMFFVAGADLKQLLASLLTAGLTLYLAISRTPYAVKRLEEFVEGWGNPALGSYQVKESLLALARGGLFGMGLGDGLAKDPGGVPLPWTDSIFAVVGEELGLVGALAVVILFMAFAYRGLSIALKAHDHFGLVLGCGITAWLAFQAFLNIAVSTATLPFTGLTLPFISYGGSSLLACMAGVGVLLSISRYGSRNPATNGKPASTAGTETAVVRRWNRWARLPDLGRSRRSKTRSQASSGARYARRRTSSGFAVKSSSTRRAKGLSRRITRTRRSIARRTSSRRPSKTAGKRVPRRR